MTSARIAALALCLLFATTGCDKLAPTADSAPKGLAGVRAALVARNFSEAVELAAAEVKAHPKDPAAHFERARAEALAGNEGRALDALDQAVSLGLPDAARALEDPAFARIGGSDRFAALVERASPVSDADPDEGIVASEPRRRGSDQSVAIREKPGGGTHIQAGDVTLDTDF